MLESPCGILDVDVEELQARVVPTERERAELLPLHPRLCQLFHTVLSRLVVHLVECAGVPGCRPLERGAVGVPPAAQAVLRRDASRQRLKVVLCLGARINRLLQRHSARLDGGLERPRRLALRIPFAPGAADGLAGRLKLQHVLHVARQKVGREAALPRLLPKRKVRLVGHLQRDERRPAALWICAPALCAPAGAMRPRGP
mmetsp:Transcript_22/g.55  ORF Transcript_22/g.55 Transcript_22/m.55 type:complete len:201 (-) Transcript_22:3103-3705(-)